MEGPLAGQEFPVNQRTVIGRQVSCDIQLPDRGISREHCHVEPHGAGFMVVDGASPMALPLMVSEYRALHPAFGDLISVGDTDGVYRWPH